MVRSWHRPSDEAWSGVEEETVVEEPLAVGRDVAGKSSTMAGEDASTVGESGTVAE